MIRWSNLAEERWTNDSSLDFRWYPNSNPVPLSSTVSIHTNTNVLLSLGIVEILGSAIVSNSFSASSGGLTLGVIESLSSAIHITTTISTPTATNIVTLDSGCLIQSITSIPQLARGIVEILGSTSITNTVFGSTITLGVIENLSSHSIITTKTSGGIIIGVVEVLSSHSNVHSSCNAGISFGVIESLSGNSHTGFSTSTPTLYNRGNIKGLCTIGTSTFGYINFGADKLFNSTSYISSSVSGNLVLGVIELLSGNSHVVTSIPTITIYNLAHLKSVCSIQSNVLASTLSFGRTESLSSRANVSSRMLGGLTLGGIEILLSSNCNPNVLIPPAELTRWIGLSSTTHSITNVSATTLEFGVIELLGGSVIIHSYSHARLNSAIYSNKLFTSISNNYNFTAKNLEHNFESKPFEYISNNYNFTAKNLEHNFESKPFEYIRST